MKLRAERLFEGAVLVSDFTVEVTSGGVAPLELPLMSHWLTRNSLFNRPNAAPTKYTAQYLCISAAIEIPIGINDGAGTAREGGEAVQLKVALENDAIRDIASYRTPNFPQCR